MKIDITCPIEILKTEVLSDDRGRCRGYIDIINVSEHPIRRIEGAAAWLNDVGGELLQFDVTFDGMKIVPHGYAQLTVAGEIPAAASIVFDPSEIAFADFSESWTSDESEIVEYDFFPEPPGPACDRLRGIAGQDAVCYPEMRSENWLCVCGRLNSGESHVCARCQRGRERVFAALRADDPARSGSQWDMFSDRLERRKRFDAKREELRIQSERSKRRKRERRIKITVGISLGILLIGALLAIGIFMGWVIF